MKRYAAALLLVFVAIGCGKSPQPPAPVKAVEPPAQPQANAANTQQDSMEGKGADFRLFDSDPTTGTTRKPRLWMHVDSFSLAEEKIWKFQKAHAVIYGRDDQMEDMYMEAGGGVYQEAKSAYLKDGVVAKIGGMELELQDIEWRNDEGVAQSDNPVTIKTPDSDLKASSVRIYHKEKQIVLTDVTGTLRLERAKQ